MSHYHSTLLINMAKMVKFLRVFENLNDFYAFFRLYLFAEDSPDVSSLAWTKTRKKERRVKVRVIIPDSKSQHIRCCHIVTLNSSDDTDKFVTAVEYFAL